MIEHCVVVMDNVLLTEGAVVVHHLDNLFLWLPI